MKFITATNSNDAWRETFTSLMNSNLRTDNNKYYRDESIVIEITNPTIEDSDPLFPIPAKDIKLINRYITTGKDEDQVIHEWTKIYYHRIFDEPNSQVEFMIRKLQEPEPTGECQISMWDKTIDQDAEISPCTQILWARIKHGKLEWHTHAHSSDAYKKLLMNLQEFISVQHYIAERLSIPVGHYIHFLDSCHIHYKDSAKAKKLLSKLNSKTK